MRLTALILAAACLHAATATTFDGQQAAGELAVAGEGRIRVGGRELALTDVDAITLGSGPSARREGGLGVLLRDGSWLPATAVAAAEAADRLAVRTPYGAVVLPLESVAGWGDPAPPPPQAGGGDAVLVESGVLGGRLLGIADGALRFQSTLDPEALVLPVQTVRAARLDLRPSRPAGLRLRLADADLDLVLVDGGVALAAAPQARLDAAALGGAVLRVEGGRRAYLSDLKPVEVREDGMFGVVWPHVRDGSIAPGGLQLGGRRHAKGLTVHSVATLAWDVDGAIRLRALAGIADQLAPEGDCIAVLAGDGRELWRARLRGGDAPRGIDLDLAGVKRLELRVEAGERHDIGDHVVLADAQLIRR